MHIYALRMPLVPYALNILKSYILAQTVHSMYLKVDASSALKYAKTDHPK